MMIIIIKNNVSVENFRNFPSLTSYFSHQLASWEHIVLLISSHCTWLCKILCRKISKIEIVKKYVLLSWEHLHQLLIFIIIQIVPKSPNSFVRTEVVILTQCKVIHLQSWDIAFISTFTLQGPASLENENSQFITWYKAARVDNKLMFPCSHWITCLSVCANVEYV